MVLQFVGTPQKLTVVVGPDPTVVANVVVPVVEPFAPKGQFQAGGGASGSVVMVVVVVSEPVVCEMAKTCAEAPLAG
jgi:hypothetical protein